MAFVFQNQLDQAAERRSQAYFATLSEKDQRRFAALEAQRLGHRDIIYVAKSERTSPGDVRQIAKSSLNASAN